MILPKPLMRYLVALVVTMGASVCFAQGESPAAGGGQYETFGRGPGLADDLWLSAGAAERLLEWPVGPFRVRPRVEVTAIYDSNVYLDEGETTDDSYVTISPGVMLIYGNEHHNYAYADYAFSVPTFFSEKDEDIESYTLTLFGHYEKGKTGSTVWYRLRDVREADTVVGSRVTKEQHVMGGSVERWVSSKTSVSGSGRYEDHAYDEPTYTDYEQVEGSVRVKWQALPKTAFFGQAAFGEVDVEDDERSYGDAQYTELSVGVRGRLRPKVGTVARVGWQVREFDERALDDVERWTASVKVDARVLAHLRAKLGVWSSLRPAVNAAGFTTVETRIEPALSRRIGSDRLIGTVAGFLGFVEYRGSPDPVGPSSTSSAAVYDGREDEYWGWSALLDWWMYEHVSLGAGFSYIENDSDADAAAADRGTSYDGSRAWMRLAINL